MTRKFMCASNLAALAVSAGTLAAYQPETGGVSSVWTGSPPVAQWLRSAGKPAATAGDMGPVTGDADSAICRGWPVDLQAPGAGFPYTPTLYDIDGDGAAEIFLTGGHTFGLFGDGTFLPGWPTQEHIYMGYGTNASKPGPSGADMDNDGDREVLWTERDWWAGTSHMWCFNGRNLDGSDMDGFPQYAPDDYSNALDTPFVLGDADGDGYLEAWGPHTLGNAFIHYRLSAFDHLGNRLFTTDLDPDENMLSLYFGDVDGDGDKDMFAVSFLDPSVRLHVFESDGSEATGYPIVLHTFSGGNLPFGPPVPVDLDHDGDLEILIGHYQSSTSRVYCHHHDGSAYDGFPIQIATSSQLFYIGLGDVTGDGEPELTAFDNYIGHDYRAFVINIADGTPLDGWPYDIPDWPKCFPTVVDVDGDGLQDICAATEGGELYAISSDGKLISGYPKSMVTDSVSGVAAGDIDGDGLFELVAATWDGWVYAWDTDGPALPEMADWPMRGINPRNTGVFGAPIEDCPADVNTDGVVDIDDLFQVLAEWGPCDACPEDINDDGVVDIDDVFAVLADWGPCP